MTANPIVASLDRRWNREHIAAPPNPYGFGYASDLIRATGWTRTSPRSGWRDALPRVRQAVDLVFAVLADGEPTGFRSRAILGTTQCGA
jgi:hypothetical protein